MFSLGHVTEYVDSLIVKSYNIRSGLVTLVCLRSSYMRFWYAAWLLALRNNFTSHLASRHAINIHTMQESCRLSLPSTHYTRVESILHHIPDRVDGVKPPSLADYVRCPTPAL